MSTCGFSQGSKRNQRPFSPTMCATMRPLWPNLRAALTLAALTLLVVILAYGKPQPQVLPFCANIEQPYKETDCNGKTE